MSVESDDNYSSKLLQKHGIVDTTRGTEAILFRTGTDSVDIGHVNESAEKGILYFNERGIAYEKADETVEKVARYKMIPIGYTDKNTGYPLCASFMKGPYMWEGIFVGTVDKLIEKIMKSIKDVTEDERRSIENFKGNFEIIGFGLSEVLKNNSHESVTEVTDKIAQQVKRRSVCDEIYDRLLIKENWTATSKNRLSIYIKSLLEKVSYEQSLNEGLTGNGYVLSIDEEKCLINTGLIDIFNNDIYIIDQNNKEADFFRKDIILASSKASILNLGFDKENIMIMPKPIKFYENKADLVFDGTLEEFDLEDDYRLNHIIGERRMRFPAEYRDMHSDILCEKVKSAIGKALRISERDYKYIVPMYNLKMHKIQYLMPLYLNKSIDDSPELVIVVGENNGFYCVYTILTTDDAYDNARLLCRPDSSWLKI